MAMSATPRQPGVGPGVADTSHISEARCGAPGSLPGFVEKGLGEDIGEPASGEPAAGEAGELEQGDSAVGGGYGEPAVF